jgi:YD repeat-containing protein
MQSFLMDILVQTMTVYDYFLCNVYTGAQVLRKMQTFEKRGNETITETLEYDYNIHHQLVKEVAYLSDKEKKETHYIYPNHFSNLMPGNPITSDVIGMINSNQLSQWIEKRVYVKRNVNEVETTTILSAEFKHAVSGTDKIRSIYTFNNSYSLSTFPPINSVGGLLQLNTNYEKQLSETVDVDSRGNVLTEVDKNGIMTAYLWGYNGNYPIAKLIGTDHVTALQYVDPVILSTGTDLQISQELSNLRNGFEGSDVQIYTYAYQPLVGITISTDPNGVSHYFKYDNFGRLKQVADQNNNVIRTYKYHYRNNE